VELNHLRSFYEVAKAGGFSAAARKLRISQSALSKAVGLLESHHGIVLFERSKRGINLTAAGQSIFADCVTIFAKVEHITDTLRRHEVTCEGLLRFGASDHLARYLLVQAITSFQNKFPRIIPSLYVGSPPDLVTRILAGDLEFGLSFTHLDMPGLVYQRIGRSELVLVNRGKHGKSRGKRNPDEPFIPMITSISREYQKQPSHRVFAMYGERAAVAFECNSQDLQKRFCLAGMGSVLLARFMVEEELKSGALIQIPTEDEIFADFLLMKRSTHVLSLGAQTFIDSVVRNLSV
jgi:DNA-binding transcriptional LysR family regulator